MAQPEIIKDIDARIIRPTSTDNAIVRFDGVAGQVQNSLPLIDDDGSVLIKKNTDPKITLSTDGQYTIGTNLGTLNLQNNAAGSGSNIEDGNITSITFGHGGTTQAGIYCSTSGSYGTYLMFATTNSYANGAKARMVIDHLGNIGIGTVSPSYKLHVNGTAYITDTLISSYHNFVVSGNEFNFLPESYGNSLWLNYVSGVSRNRTTNALTDYYFGNGQGAATTTLHASTFDGNATTATLAMSSKDTGHASYRTTSSTSYILVRIKSAQSYWMTAFTLRVYQGYNHYDVTFSGYQYGANYWYSPKATLSSSTIANLTVYFGYISQAEMWVAIPGGDYTGAKILNVVNGYYNFTDIANAFTIENVTSLPGTTQSTQTIYRPWIRGEAVTGAVWNDYAEYREADTIEPGYVLIEKGDDTLTKSTERLSPFAGVSSDTWGFSQGKTDKAKTPIAVAGRVLVYTWQDCNNYKPGDCVCAAPEGKVDIMTREEIIQYPDRIVGTVSSVPTYDKWGGGENADRESVDVNGRIWIKVR